MCSAVLNPPQRSLNSQTHYYWTSSLNDEYFLEGELFKDGVLEFNINLKDFSSKKRSHTRGADVFKEMLRHFGVKNIRAIRGIWSSGDNYDVFLKSLPILGAKKAALKTWTGQQAARWGFTRVKTVSVKDRHIEVLFTRPLYNLKRPFIFIKGLYQLDFLDDD